MGATENAKRVLTHYFQVLFEKQGLRYDPDYQVELEGVVDDFIAAAVEAARAETVKMIEELKDGTAELIDNLEAKVDQPDWRQRR